MPLSKRLILKTLSKVGLPSLPWLNRSRRYWARLAGISAARLGSQLMMDMAAQIGAAAVISCGVCAIIPHEYRVSELCNNSGP